MAKAVLQKALEDNRMDVQLAMLQYRNSPVAGMKHSPAEILFSRRLRDNLPRSEESLKPCVVNVIPERLIGAKSSITTEQQRKSQISIKAKK